MWATKLGGSGQQPAHQISKKLPEIYCKLAGWLASLQEISGNFLEIWWAGCCPDPPSFVAHMTHLPLWSPPGSDMVPESE